MTGQPLDAIPMWLLYPLTVLSMLVTMEVGYRLTRARQRKSPDKTEGFGFPGAFRSARRRDASFYLGP